MNTPCICSYCGKEPDIKIDCYGVATIRCPWGTCYSLIADAGVSVSPLEVALDQWEKLQEKIIDEKAVNLEAEMDETL